MSFKLSPINRLVIQEDDGRIYISPIERDGKSYNSGISAAIKFSKDKVIE